MEPTLINRLIVGTHTDTDYFDLKLLLASRLLIQASSGGGKSYLLRRICENAQGRVQTIVIDPEGEFASLREKFNFVLAGPGGETTVDPFSATLLAHKLLEIGTSAVCDISELKHNARHEWVRNFIDGLIESPKKLWHPVLVIVDEAHLFAPEKGQGESVAFQSMANLASMGRKRGLCAIFATQRLSKFSKNVAAELHNVLIGMTFLNLDSKRAAETMGVLKSEEKQFIADLKSLDPGNFFALGRAISKTMIKLKVAEVTTTHPKVGSKIKARGITTTPSEIKHLLPQLQDLPQQAQARARTESELRAEINKLNSEIVVLKKAQPKALPAEVQKVNVVSDKQITRVEKTIPFLEGMIKRHAEQNEKAWTVFTTAIKDISQALASIKKAPTPIAEYKSPMPKVSFETTAKIVDRIAESNRMHIIKKESRETNYGTESQITVSILSKAEKAILKVLAQSLPGTRSKRALALIAGYTHSGGGFNNAIGSLRTKGLLNSMGDNFSITSKGVDYLGSYEPLPQGAELLQYWIGQSSKAEGAILSALRKWTMMPKAELATAIGYEVTGGGFNNALGSLRTKGLISGSQDLTLAEELF